MLYTRSYPRITISMPSFQNVIIDGSSSLSFPTLSQRDRYDPPLCCRDPHQDRLICWLIFKIPIFFLQPHIPVGFDVQRHATLRSL